MQPIELNLGQALKVLWSFLWRAWVLMFPISVVCLGIMAKFMPFPKPGEPPAPPQFNGPLFFVVWLIMVVGYFLTMAQALRWTMKTKWSDFKIMAVPTMPPTDDGSAP